MNIWRVKVKGVSSSWEQGGPAGWDWAVEPGCLSLHPVHTTHPLWDPGQVTEPVFSLGNWRL